MQGSGRDRGVPDVIDPAAVGGTAVALAAALPEEKFR